MQIVRGSVGGAAVTTGRSTKLENLFGWLRRRAIDKPRIASMPGGDQIVWAKNFGPAMDEAMEAARQTLPVFWAWHETRSDDPNDCALKVRFATGASGAEYIWFIDILRTDRSNSTLRINPTGNPVIGAANQGNPIFNGAQDPGSGLLPLAGALAKPAVVGQVEQKVGV